MTLHANDGLASADEPDGRVHDRLDVARLLEEQLLADSEVLIGHTGMSALVTWCLPVAEANLSSRELTGVVVVGRAGELRDDPVELTRRLRSRGAAALFVIPDEGGLPGLARTKLPIVRLPAGVDYAATSRLVAELALAKEAHVLRYGVAVHRSLAELLYRGSGLGALARQLSRLSGCPVFVLDPTGKPLVHEYEGRGQGPVTADVIAGLQKLPLALVVEPTESLAESIRLVKLDMSPKMNCLLSPIVLAGRHDGWVAMLELDNQPAWHDLARHRVIVEQATMIIGTEMLRLRSVEAAEERARGDFVHALLHGRFANQDELRQRADHYGFDAAGNYGIVVARGFRVTGSGESLQKMLTLARAVTQVLPRKGVQTLSTVVGDVLVVVRQVDTSGQRQDAGSADAQIAEFAAAVSRDLQRRVGEVRAVAYGRPVAGAGRIMSSYEEARIALGVCERLGTTEPAGYGELRVFAALMELAESPQGRAFADEVLAPLRRSDRKGGGDLEQAVLEYIAAGGNLNAVARKLAMHRNTMLYKINRASRVLGMDLRQAENQFTVWLAYRIEMLSDVRTKVTREIKPKS
jgi:sugar diacid utilization regulator